MMKSLKRISIALCLSVGLLPTLAGAADAFPEKGKVIRIITPLSAGGSSDI